MNISYNWLKDLIDLNNFLVFIHHYQRLAEFYQSHFVEQRNIV